jgi:hypothetical protein
LSEDNTIEGLTNNMQDFATATSEVILGLAIIADKLKQLTTIPGLGSVFDVRNIPVVGGYIGGLQQLGRNAMPQQDRGGQERTAGRINAQQRKLESQAIKSAVTLRKAENEQLKKKTAVDQLRDKFDLERIGLAAALNAATDEETKLRIKAQIAILDNNEALAKKLLAEMEAAEAVKKMAESMAKSAAALEAAFQATIARLMIFDPLKSLRPTEADILATLGTLTSGTRTRGGGGVTAPLTPYDPLSSLTTTTADLAATGYRYDPLSGMRATAQDIRITIDTAGSGDKLSQAIAESIQVATRSGYSTVPNGFIV